MGFDEEAAQYGKELVTDLHILLRTAQIHGPTNIALENPLQSLFHVLNQLFRHKERIHLRLVDESLFLDDTRLKMDIDRFVGFTAVMELLRRLQIGEIVFHPGLKADELKQFVYFLIQIDPKSPPPFQSLIEQFQKTGIIHVEIEAPEEKKEDFGSGQADIKETAKSSYFKALTIINEVMEDVRLGQAFSMKRAKRVVQTMVDVLLAEESTLLGLTTLRSHDLYTHHHCVNVCILSLVMGQRLGYTKRQLTELGLAGLFHDMGKADIPAEVLNKPTDFNEEEWRLMRRHPIQGVKSLLRLKGINETTVRVASGVFEHHLNYDLSGYPKLDSRWELSLLGRIIGIVDCYDALTSSRVYNRIPYSPEKALRFMLTQSGKAFDPILMKIFVNCIGIFPIGTLVLLNTRELAVVMEAPPNPKKADRPRVKIITDPTGNETDGSVVDLSKEAHDRFIIRTVDPRKHKIDVSRYFT